MSNISRWTASCWMGSATGRIDIEVNAATSNGAIQQLKNVYGAEQIRNLRRVRTEVSGGSSLPSGSSIWIASILGCGALFLYFTPWVLMIIYGGLSTWASEKLTDQSVREYTDTPDDETTENQHKKAMITVCAALLLGGVGFVQGTFINKDLNVEYNLDGKQTQVQQIKK